MILRLQNVVRVITDHLGFVYSYFSSLLASCHKAFVLDTTVLQIQKQHTHSHVSKTHKIFTFSTFFRTNLQKVSLIVSLIGKEGSLPYPSHFCLFNFITTCVCEREREEGGRDGGKELGNVMSDAEMSLCML